MADFGAVSQDSSKCLRIHVINITDMVTRHAYSQLLETISRNVELTRGDVKKLADHITSRTAGPIDNRATSSGIPLNPRKEDYQNLLNWWDQSLWQSVKNKSNPMDLGDADSPIISRYMEDEFGRSITPGVKAALRRDLYCYWNDLSYSDPNDLRNHGELGLKRKEHFRQTFEEKYPWLRLCEAHWKVDQLWVSYFSTWKRPRNTPDPKMKESTPTSTSADKATSPAPVCDKLLSSRSFSFLFFSSPDQSMSLNCFNYA